jgi:catechol 2,3-dioxygenase-like lactoylglutathione lyase family enzyme
MSLVFSHVALNCRDPLATERFYVRHFGFRRARVIPLGAEQIVFLKAGSVYLELFQAKGDPPGPRWRRTAPATAACATSPFKWTTSMRRWQPWARTRS